MYKQIMKPYNVQVFSGNFGLYRDLSRRVQDIIKQETNSFELYSIDESFIEVSAHNIPDYEEWATNLRLKIMRWTGVPVAIGVARTKTLAKIAVWHAKHCRAPRGGPDGKAACSVCQRNPRESVCDVSGLQSATPDWQVALDTVPVGDVWGIGRRLTKKLLGQQIDTAYRLASGTDGWQRQNFNVIGRRTVRELHGEVCFWLDQDIRGFQKSIMVTRSFGRAVYQCHELEAAVARFASKATEQLRDKGEVASGLLVFVRTHLPHQTEQTTYKASTSLVLERPTDDTLTVVRAAGQAVRDLFKSDYGYKKAGVILYNLVPKTAQQLRLTDTGETLEALGNRDSLMQGVDHLTDRYGERVVVAGSELQSRQWHSLSQQRSPITMRDWQHIPTVRL